MPRQLRIARFDELDDPYEFLTLMSQGFGWNAHPRRVATIRRADPRYRDPYGFCALAGDRLAGFVGAMDLPVRTLDRGDEMAGGFFAIATRPEFTRRGIARRLILHTQRHFRARGYRFSFLYTSRSLVAFSLYEGLGYHDIPEDEPGPGRWVRIFRTRKPGRRRPGKPTRAQLRQVYRLFDEAAAGWTGFARRPDDWLRTALKSGRITPADLLIDPDGYALTSSGWDTTYLFEIVARNPAAYRRLIERARDLGRPVLVGFGVYDPVLLGVYHQLGFRRQRRVHSTVMYRELGRTRYRTAFGDRFRVTPVDAF